MNLILTFITGLLLLAVVAFLMAPVAKRRRFLGGLTAAVNAGLDGVVPLHPTGQLPKFSAAAIADRWVLGKLGADVDHVILTTAAVDRAFCIITDEAPAAESPINIALLGNTPGTLKVRVDGNVVVGAELTASGTAGRAQPLPVAAGTYFVIGRALIAGAQGDLVEFIHHAPVSRVVP